MTDIEICTNCPLATCDESSKECLYRVPIRDYNRAAYQKFYQINRQSEIDRVMQWQRENKDKLAIRQKRYYENKKQRLEKARQVEAI